MTTLLSAVYPRTLRTLTDRFTAGTATRIEAWLFEDEAARRDAQRTLAARGIDAVLRSAYKPLVHFFIEEFTPPRTGRIVIRTPAGAHPRFRLEAYPLAGWLAPLEFAFEPGDAPAHYVVETGGATHRVFAPNDATASPCGWLRAWNGDALIEDAPLVTEFEAASAATLDALRAHPWPDHAPFFDILRITIATSGIERTLPYGEELVSTLEAWTEDAYYGAAEFFHALAGRDAADRTLQSGQIVPEIVRTEGDTTVRVVLDTHTRADTAGAAAVPAETLASPAALAAIDQPLSPPEVARALDALPGERFGVTSHQGRGVNGIYVHGALPGLVITAGQHANETSGVVGALRAAHALNARPDAHYALVPLENPDGAALHHQLRATHPAHLSHAARFTALGDDLEARTQAPFGEKAARLDAIARTGARLHLSLHGYPAHEWTRPRSGYVPRGSELWSIPKGFFLILRHHAGHDGRPFLDALTHALSQSDALVAFNERQLHAWHAHAGDLPFPRINGIPCHVIEDHRSSVPFTLVTEFPDETIEGDAFRLAHATQTRAVELAAGLYWSGLLG
ncbi:hypothetical protein BBJ41_33145 [Burkholderia stabilis]|uniref:hypothetical protein n=1 Tax=Burkholderia stabilis TaxID=95485 RepID=UPI00085219EF|nr:hypothetical protein [Burkholderia stabilis]AOR72488.1 hypothetical protein BBJ41_33145 [Burkholderia stabilis]HDR9489608.1 hypothetical protein [Burkholderia stabilis]HDR9536425.1 hypothetical protein [Burkholderia stabilis]HDR9551938.1 hypothetical protein [Burkholderia stabilis]HDR9559955.1 hypothetical protein [Burkholderia stabilis]